MKKITPEIQANRVTWIKALESGKYNQCQYALVSGSGFCCLGVAHVVLHPEIDANSEYNGLNGARGWKLTAQVNAMYKRVNISLGMTTRDKDTCIAWNDDKRLTFPEIAKKLREKWKIVE